MKETEKQNKTKILIIEDDTFIMDMYGTKFNMSGFEVLKAEDGVKGIKVVKKEKPDIIVLDIIMPQMDGFETLKVIKNNQELKSIPVILLTNLGQRENIEEGLKLGADDYIIKAHFTPDEVVEKVEKVLKKAKD
ncbi:MAG: response regulator [Nitrospiraceae bacterium]|nr:response regulator [Nitrospiraceae bacterium]